MSKPAQKNFPPKVRGSYPWQSIRQLAKNVIPFISEKQKTVGDIYMVDAPINFIVLSHPDHIRHVLQANWKNYKKGYGYRNFSLIIGKGILTSEAEYWKRHRKMVQPMFYKEQVNSIINVMIETACEFVTEWKKTRAGSKLVEAKSEMTNLSLNIIANSLLGKDAGNYIRALRDDIAIEYDFVMKRNKTVFPFPLWVPTPKILKFKQARKRMDTIVFDMLKKRRATPDSHDLLTLLMNAKDENGISMNDTEIRDEFLTIFIAGYETTAIGLTWIIYLLAKHPEIQKKLKKELKEVLVDGSITLEKLKKLNYLKAVINETMRLYPPIWTFGRQSIGEDEIGGYKIPKNTHMLLSVYLCHRHPAFYESPEEFDPERFMNSNEKPQAFLPFGAGPRLCVGNHFALMEMEISVASLLYEFTVSLKSNEPIGLDPEVALKPKGKVEIYLS